MQTGEGSAYAAIPGRLPGYRVALAEGICAALANGVVGALFGGVNQAYRIADRSGLAVMRWYVRRRVGGALTNPEAVKALVLGLAP